MKKITIIASAFLLLGWGGTGHRFINSQAVSHLPSSMQSWIAEASFFGSHASDADNRKGSDPTEGPKHFIDLELYPSFHALSDNLDSLKSAVGASVVQSNGSLPWATRIAYDSLVSQLRRNEWETAKLTASDIGHYVGDGHQPLHNTNNYNGQLTGNGGIHSRYETQMINAFEQQLSIMTQNAVYVDDVFAYCLAYSIAGNAYVDSIMAADDAAKSISGWSGSGSPPQSYYQAMWDRTKGFTLTQMQKSTEALANLWYSAALDAGTLTTVDDEGGHGMSPSSFGLHQNYPNPFNPRTTIRFLSSDQGPTTLTVHDLSGKTVARLIDRELEAGEHEIGFDASRLSSGIYLYRLESGSRYEARKMLLVR